MSHARTRVDVDASSDRFHELQEREPQKSPDEIVEAAMELYRHTNKPWIALEERENHLGSGQDDA